MKQKTFEKAFKLPFEADSFASWIYDSQGNFCIDFVSDVSPETVKRIVAVINGEEKVKRSEAKSIFNPKTGTIAMQDKNGKMKEVLRVRGWGYLTGTGGLHLLEEEAAEIQDSLGRFIAYQLTYKEHTPTPWKRRTYTSNAHVITKGDKDIAYTPDFSETGKEDADFIVKSVNNHDRLVEALGHCIQIMEDLDVPDHLMETYGNAMMNYSSFITELKTQ